MPAFTQMNERTTHRVKSGERPGISLKYGVRVSEIKRWNGLKSDVIRVGQRIVVYPVDSNFSLRFGLLLTTLEQILQL